MIAEAHDLREIRLALERIETRLAGAPGLAVAPPPAAAGREFYTCAQFATLIGRKRQWVSDRCFARVIKTLPGGKPYRIPEAEAARFLGKTEATA